MNEYYKYPRTLHLPWSLGVQSDDKVLKDASCFEGKQVVITEKMDGENTTMYSDHIHARSISSRHHPSQDWVKAYWYQIAHQIPKGMRIFGENLYAQHSIKYDCLESYFYVFSIWDGTKCLDWSSTKELASELGLIMVPTLYEGEFDLKLLNNLTKKLNLEEIEGYVIRNQEGFEMPDFQKNIAKYVCQGHIQTGDDWKRNQVVVNGLKDKSNDN